MCQSVFWDDFPKIVDCVLGDQSMGSYLCSLYQVGHLFGEREHVAEFDFLCYLFVKEVWLFFYGLVISVLQVVLEGGFSCFFGDWFDGEL